ncbi:MAG: hypothetical protein LUQ37_04180, partial [Methanoregulaceae archaeon]|nr:hypothetical protein [Methanoregulaceae archaeon]
MTEANGVITQTNPRSGHTMRVMLGRKVVVFGMVVVLAFVIVAIFAPLIAPYDPYAQNLDAVRQQPSTSYLLGT